MKKVLLLLAVLAIAATPAMASTKLEANHGKKHALRHVETKHQKKQLKKKAVKKLAKHNGRKHKVAV